MADEFQVTLVRLGKGGKVAPPGEGWELMSMAASLAPGSVWLAWRLRAPARLNGCPTCKAVAKDDAGKCLGCGTTYGK